MVRRKPLLKKPSLSFLEKVYVQHAHPVNFVMTAVGWMWGAYFLWQQNLVLAVAFGIGFPLIGHLSVWGHHEEQLSETWYGKLMLIHAHPINFVFHIVAFIVICLGLYANVVEMVMWGLTVLLFGHVWGWGRVNLEE
jgi:hypothetical protein